MTALENYQAFYRKSPKARKANFDISHYLKWYDTQGKEFGFLSMLNLQILLMEIENYTAEYQKIFPHNPIDNILLDIFSNLSAYYELSHYKITETTSKADNPSINDFSDRVKFCHKVRNAIPKSFIDSSGNILKNDINVIIFILRHNPDIDTVKIKKIANLIKDIVQYYYSDWGSREVTIKELEILSWLLIAYPQVVSRQWTIHKWIQYMLERPKPYRKTQITFPVTYPFSRITVESFQSGDASVIVKTKTELARPYLNSLYETSIAQAEYEGVRLNLSKHLSERELLYQVSQVLQCLEELVSKFTIECRGELDAAKHKILATVKQLVSDRADGFVSTSCAQAFTPQKKIPSSKSLPSGSVIEFTFDQCARMFTESTYLQAIEDVHRSHKLDLTRAVKTKNIKAVAEILSKDVSPRCGREAIYSLLTLNPIPLVLLYKKPGEESIQHMIEERNIILSKEKQKYYLYTYTNTDGVKRQVITEEQDVFFLDEFSAEIFFLDSAIDIIMNRKLKSIIERTLSMTLETMWTSIANRKIAILSLLIEYGLDISARVDTHGPTYLEQTIAGSFLHSAPTELYKGSVKTIIKLMLQFDNRQSCLIVAPQYRGHYIGRIILESRTDLYNAQNHPKCLQSVSLGFLNARPALRFINHKKKEVYLQTYTLLEFQHKKHLVQQILDLSFKRFSKGSKMEKDEIQDYVLKKLIPDGNSYIDILLDQERNVVAFNIAKIMTYIEPSQPTILYIPLAVAEKYVQQDFKRLMSIVSFRRVFLLSAKYGKAVLTAYNAASATSYLQSATLKVYPKYDCLQEDDWQRLKESIFQGRNVIKDDYVRYFPSKLQAYQSPKTSSGLQTTSSINCEAFNQRYKKDGCSTLVAFYSSPANTSRLYRKLQQQLQSKPSFSDIVRGTNILDDFSIIQMKARL